LHEENKLLKDRIEFLKKADEQVIREKKVIVSDIKLKIKTLQEQKQGYEKTIAQNQAKLAEYQK
jgi:hypothetical protein